MKTTRCEFDVLRQKKGFSIVRRLTGEDFLEPWFVMVRGILDIEDAWNLVTLLSEDQDRESCGGTE
jgi:hypothetical protein